MTAALSAKLEPADTQRIFRAVLGAFARPGRVQLMLELPLRTVPAAMVPVLALANLETGVCVLGPDRDWPALVRTATSAPTAPLERARLVAALRELAPEELLAAFRGSAAAPESAATICLSVSTVDDGAAYRLVGPGVSGSLDVRIPLARELVRARAQAVADFPSGVDLLLASPDGRVMGIPRSTQIEQRRG